MIPDARKIDDRFREALDRWVALSEQPSWDRCAAPGCEKLRGHEDECGPVSDQPPFHLLHDAAQATLLFHSGSPWTPEKAAEWKRLTGSDDATTKALCDFIRIALAKVEGRTP